MLNGFLPNSHGQTCLVPHSDEFEGQGQGEQGQETAFFSPFSGLGALYVW